MLIYSATNLMTFIIQHFYAVKSSKIFYLSLLYSFPFVNILSATNYDIFSEILTDIVTKKEAEPLICSIYSENFALKYNINIIF